jgi:hypothetical protein
LTGVGGAICRRTDSAFHPDIYHMGSSALIPGYNRAAEVTNLSEGAAIGLAAATA